MAYKILFVGELKDGVTHDQTVQLLAKFTRLTPEAAEKRFFSGAAVRIKTFPDRQQAEAFQTRLLKAGLVVEVDEVTPSTEPQTAPHSSQPEPTGNETPRRRRRWPVVALVALVLIAGAGGGGYFWLHQLLQPTVSEAVIQSENALYSSNTAVLGHINVGALVELESTFNGDSSSLLAKLPFIEELQAAGLDPNENINDIVFTVDHHDSEVLVPSLVVIGNFTEDSVKNYFNQHYETETSGPYTVFKKRDRTSCEYSTPRAFDVSPGRLVISSPEQIGSLSQRLQQASKTSSLPSSWQQYRSSHLASFGILKPDTTLNKVSGLPGMMLRGAIQQTAAITSIYMGAQAQVVPPSVHLQLQVNSTNSAWLDQSAAALTHAIDQQRAKAAKDDNPLGVFLDQFSHQASADQLTISLNINRTLVEQTKQMIDSGLGSLISMGPSGSEDSNTINEEQIDPEPKPYLQQVNLNDLPDFESDFFHAAQWQEGPFGISVSQALINKEGLTELEVVLVGKKIPNLPNSFYAPIGKFMISSVLDAQGNNLLRHETCGQSINSDPAEISVEFNDNLKATKRIRLIQGTKLGDVASIGGQFHLSVADKVSIETLPAPLNDHHLSSQSAKIEQASNSTLAFSINPKSTTLLDLRALNAQQQHLKQSLSSFGTDSNKSINAEVQGKIGFVEVVSAVHKSKIEHSFELATATPKFQGNFQQPMKLPPVISEGDWQTLIKESEWITPEQEQTWQGKPIYRNRFGPMILDMYSVKLQRGFAGMQVNGRYNLYLPYHPKLTLLGGNMVNLSINQLRLKDGQTIALNSPTTAQINGRTSHEKDIDVKPSYPHRQHSMIKLLAGGTSFQMDIPNMADESTTPDLAQIDGTLSFYAPLKLRTQSIDFPALGESIDMVDLKLQPLALKSNQMVIAVNGNQRRLAGIYIINDQGEKIGELRNLRQPTDFDKILLPEQGSLNLAEVSLDGATPKSLLLVYSETLFQQDYPLSIPITEE